MVSLGQVFSVCLVLVACKLSQAVELTFELADNAKECFYQDIDKGTSVTLEFQVRVSYTHPPPVTCPGEIN